MRIKKLEVGPIETNCYILTSSGKAVVIDPGDEPERILETIEEEKAELEYIIYTHAHYDHISGSGPLKEKTRAKVCIGASEKRVFEDPSLSFKVLAGGSPPAAPPDILLKEGDIIKSGDIELKVLDTPGHTPGGISLLSGKYVFTGDALFAGSVGRTDFPQSSHEALIRGIEKRLLTLDDEVEVFPGHGPSTNIGRERRLNPFLR